MSENENVKETAVVTAENAEAVEKNSLIVVKQLPVIEEQLKTIRADIEHKVSGVLALESVFFPDETPTGTNYIWYSPYNSGGSAEYGGIILEAVPFNGDEKKLHAEVETKDYTFDNTAVNGKNGSIAVEIS